MCVAKSTRREEMGNPTATDDNGGSSRASDAAKVSQCSTLQWPEDRARNTLLSAVGGIYSRWTYRYMNRIFRKGARQKKEGSMVQLTQEDLYATPADMEAARLGSDFWSVYAREGGNFLRTLWFLAAPTFIPAGLCQLVALVAQLSIPILVMQLLRALEDDPYGNVLRGTMPYAILIFVMSITNALCTHRHQYLSYKSGIVIRTAVVSAIYEKSLALSPKGRAGLTSGQVTNLVATDTQKLYEVMHEAHMIWSAPLAIAIVVALLLAIIGPTCLVGAFILVALVPLSKWVALEVVRIRRKRVAVADERIEIVTAMLQGIKVTKLNNYEDKFEARVAEARRREMKLVRKEQAVWGMTLVIRVFTPVLAGAATFATFTLVSEDNILTASTSFTILMLYNMLKFPINQAGQLLSKLALGIQAAHRVSLFLDRDGRDVVSVCSDSSGNDETGPVLKVTNGTFLVGSEPEMNCCDGDVDVESNAAFTLSGVNFEVARGEVLAVVGEVASGKSTLIQGLLGDVQSTKDTIVSTRGSVAYAGQSPFILSCTVRDNILFGSSFDRERYEKVLDSCCLRPDLEMWPAGDLTEIGERGVTMSGGQKQRVSIARAVYASPDIALFDDILSALDAGTSQNLFDNLFEGGDNSLLHECGVVLVTHAVHILQRVSKILILDNGSPIFYGTWRELEVYEPDSALHKTKIDSMRSSLQLSNKDSSSGKGTAQTSKETNKASSVMASVVATAEDAQKGGTMTVEEREHGQSKLGTWLIWFTYAGGLVFAIIQVLLMAADRGSYVAIDWWVATWTSAAGQSIVVFGKEFPDQMEGRSAQYRYLTVYAILVVSMLVFLTARSQWAVFGGFRAAERLFSTMTRRVLHAPMSYFDTTPLGRILNRFTYDVEVVDITLTQFMSIFIIASSWLIAGQCVMIAIVPWMAAVNAFILFIYALILRHYRWSAADLQRLDAVSRSPIQASLAEGLDGSSTIRAYHKNCFFLGTFQNYLDGNSSAMLNFLSSRRWLAVRLETLGSFVTLAACMFIVTFNEQLQLSPGIAALLIIWASSMTVTLGFLINAFSEAEAAITSIERMHSMEMLPQESSMETLEENDVDSSWPRKGVLEFKDVKMRYRPGLPLALDGLSFTLQHGNRCAVVGRTGAGKSSLTAALFRLYEIEGGEICLDGVDLSSLGLSDVRGRQHGMSVIPQDPVLFSGTLKSNLDPFSSYSDEDILQALTLVRFPGAIKGSVILKDLVEEGGANYSAGEKQLLCLARALLAKPKLLVLDEATSAVDGSTDEFVQLMLRSQFPDTTLLTIAHRLNTIMDYDTVLVMDRGRAVEFGPPKCLLANERSVFLELVNATGPESAAALKKMVK